MSTEPPVPMEDGILQFLAICDACYPQDAADALIGQQREWYDALCARFDCPLPAQMTFADDVIQGIPIRSYRPCEIATPTVLLYLHGGGFVVGSLESHHAICAEIADFAGANLISVDYRLAPEYRWPAQTNDGFAVLEHLLVRDDRVVLIGDSAGGNLAAGLALRARENGLSGIVGQVLIYPTLGGNIDARSYSEMATAPGLTTADVIYYRDVLQAPADDQIAAPLQAASLAGLPATFITAAHFDPLRDDGRHYAARLAMEGVEVWFREEPQMVHGWLRARHMSDGAHQAFHATCEVIRRFAAV